MNKYFMIVAMFLLLVSQTVSQQTQTSLDKLDWLLGKWERENVKEGTSAFENWTKASDDKFAGLGVSMKGDDTTFVETLSIVKKDDELHYVAEVSHNAEPTYFRLIEISENGFVCANPEHDFPKKIEYKLEPEGKLTATISGDGRAIPFLFTKVK